MRPWAPAQRVHVKTADRRHHGRPIGRLAGSRGHRYSHHAPAPGGVVGAKKGPMILDSAAPRILIIEHDPWIRTDLTLRLVNAGYQVRDASNGFTGVRLASGSRPDVIVLGDKLPDLTSREVREQLGSDPCTRSVPVIPLQMNGRTTSCSVTAQVGQVLAAGND